MSQEMPARRSFAAALRSRSDWRRKVGLLAALACLTALVAVACGSGPSGRAAGGGGAGGDSAQAAQIQPATSGLVTPPSQMTRTGHSRSSSRVHAAGMTGVMGSSALFGGTGTLVQQEPKLGRMLAIVRVYDHIGQPFPGPVNSRLMARGSTLLVSMDSTGTSFAAIAAGHQDAAIRTFLESVNQAAVSYHLAAIYICFEHEPDSPQHRVLGSPAEFAQAWDHVHSIAASAHLDWNDGGRLHWVFIMIHSTYAHQWADRYWPGNGEVDVVAVDGYNSSTCGNSVQPAIVTPDWLFDPTLRYAVAHGGLPVFISEWGSDTSPAGVQSAFIRRMQSYVAAHSVIRAALYWDYYGPRCNYIVDNQPASLAALAAMGHSTALQGRVPLL